MTILVLTKTDPWSSHAAHLVKAMLPKPIIWEKGRVGDALPSGFDMASFDLIISFLSPWIVPSQVLEKSRAAINFHPGSCDYPGIGCYNFALYERAKEFGAVCHHMLSRVDSGEVIDEVLFPIFPSDRVETLKLRTMIAMLEMLHRQLVCYVNKHGFTRHHRQWTRPAFTRKQLDALCEVTEDMSEDEKQRRIVATTYPGYPGPYLLSNGKKIPYPVPSGPALA